MAQSVLSALTMSELLPQANLSVARIGLLDLSSEIRKYIFTFLFSGYRVGDVTETRQGSLQRTHGIQSILFVSQRIREEAAEAFFEVVEFKISHYLLHSKYRTYNPFGGLVVIQNLKIEWARPPSKKFRTVHVEPDFVLGLRYLKHVTIDCVGVEPRRIPSKRATREVIPDMVEDIVRQYPRWMKRIIYNEDRHFQIDVVMYFKKGNFWSVDDEYRQSLEMVTLNWDTHTVKSIELYPDLCWQIRQLTKRYVIKSRVRNEEEEAQQRKAALCGWKALVRAGASHGLRSS